MADAKGLVIGDLSITFKDEAARTSITNLSNKIGSSNGIAELDANGKVPSSQLPSYVDDVVDGYYYDSKFYEESTHTTEITPESGKVYVDLSTDKTYRWSGSAYVVIGSDLALGETSSTAYRGDRGAAAYAAAVTNVESSPSFGSSNLITSGGVYTGLDDKAPKASPVFTGNISLGRKANTSAGSNSIAVGYNTNSQGINSQAFGYNTSATHDEAYAEGYGTRANGEASHAEGYSTIAFGRYSHAEGKNVTAYTQSQHVSGEFNVVDTAGTQNTRGNYVEIIGNGTADNTRSNARTLDWSGNERLMGDIYVGCNADSSGGTKLTAPVAMTGADGTNAGTAGYAPAPAATDNTKYLKGDGTWADVDALPAVTSSDNGKSLEVSNSEWTVGNEKINKKYEVDTGLIGSLSVKEWTGLTSFNGNHVWTDGENIYYSYDSDQYILDKSTSTWSTKTWDGFTELRGSHIWTDGENIYYNYNADHYVLDKSTSTWSNKTWTGAKNLVGQYIWTDGDNIYYSDGSTKQYVLDKSTSTWSTKTWSGYSGISGSNIWTDGEHFYYGTGSTNQYVLDKSTSTWSAKTWNGTQNINGAYVWTDGENIYCSDSNSHYVLDKSTSTWSTITWTGLTSFYGYYVWTDGENIYYSSGNTQYEFDRNNGSKILLGQNGEFSPVDTDGIILPTAPSSDGTYFLQCVVSSGTPTYSWVTIPNANGVSF